MEMHSVWLPDWNSYNLLVLLFSRVNSGNNTMLMLGALWLALAAVQSLTGAMTASWLNPAWWMEVESGCEVVCSSCLVSEEALYNLLPQLEALQRTVLFLMDLKEQTRRLDTTLTFTTGSDLSPSFLVTSAPPISPPPSHVSPPSKSFMSLLSTARYSIVCLMDCHCDLYRGILICRGERLIWRMSKTHGSLWQSTTLFWWEESPLSSNCRVVWVQRIPIFMTV